MKSPAVKLAPNWKAAVKAWFTARFGRDASGKITLLGDSIFKLTGTLLVWVHGFRPCFIPASVLSRLVKTPRLSKAERYAAKTAQELPAVAEEKTEAVTTAQEYSDSRGEFPAGGTRTQKATWYYKELVGMIDTFAELELPQLNGAQSLEFMCNPYVNPMYCEYVRFLDGCEEEEEYERVCKKYGSRLLHLIEEMVLKIPASRGFGKR